MKRTKSKTEKQNEKLIEKAIAVYYEACSYHRQERRKPDVSLCRISPAFVMLYDATGEIASVTRDKTHLYYALNDTTHSIVI